MIGYTYNMDYTVGIYNSPDNLTLPSFTYAEQILFTVKRPFDKIKILLWAVKATLIRAIDLYITIHTLDFHETVLLVLKNINLTIKNQFQ